MTLRDDVRDHFKREARRFPTPPGLRATVAGDAVGRQRLAHGGPNWAAAAAVVLAIAIVAGLLAAGALRGSHVIPVAPGPTPLPTQPTPIGLASGHVIDATLVFNADTGWVLLKSCTVTTCGYSVVGTRDGGVVWSKPFRVGTAFDPNDSNAPAHIHFANTTDGFVYGRGVLFATHDGGASWAQVHLSALEIVAVTGYDPVWLVVYPCAKGVVCPFAVQQSTDGGKTWTPAAPLPSGFQPSGAVALGDVGGLLLPGFGAGDMAMTLDGQTWTSIKGQCSPDTFENYVASSNSTEIWQYCGGEPPLASPPPHPPAEALYVSEDGGATWTRKAVAGGITVGALLVSPPPPGTALLTGPDRVFVSKDRGASWQTIPGVPAFVSISFALESPFCTVPCWAIDGWAIDARQLVWYTHDSGLSWRLLPQQP